MSKELVVSINVVEENGTVSLSKEVARKKITCPTDISNFGYNQLEQLQMMEDIQQSMLDNQVIFLK